MRCTDEELLERLPALKRLSEVNRWLDDEVEPVLTEIRALIEAPKPEVNGEKPSEVIRRMADAMVLWLQDSAAMEKIVRLEATQRAILKYLDAQWESGRRQPGCQCHRDHVDATQEQQRDAFDAICGVKRDA